jgi:hypothetical protein
MPLIISNDEIEQILTMDYAIEALEVSYSETRSRDCNQSCQKRYSCTDL